jgi:hypothetical protein
MSTPKKKTGSNIIPLFATPAKAAANSGDVIRETIRDYAATLAPSGDEPTFTYVDVTPETAFNMLLTNDNNRKVNDTTVSRYISDMRAGAWRKNGETLKFDRTGQLIDGQHRLEAVFYSGLTVRMAVAFNVEPEAKATVDTGDARRPHDQMAIVDGIPASYGQKYVAWANMQAMLVSSVRGGMSYAIYKKWIADNKEAVDWATNTFIRGAKGSTLTSAQVVGALVFAYPTNPEKVREFGEKLLTGIGITGESDPVKVLRDYLLITLREKHEDRRIVAFKVLRAMEFWMKGKEITKLQVTDQGMHYFAKARGGTQGMLPLFAKNKDLNPGGRGEN